ncbi:MAG: copper-binding protein [Rubrivivax sp.]|jgi:Cu(I)/Ag(I) efflux system protein CusF|nr:copper-binding protein [Rubrivivax sp.]
MLLKTFIAAITLCLAAGQAAAQATEGEVRKIDKEQGRVTLKHGDIKNLDMPAMTMVFRVRDKSLLDTVSVGDKVRFDAEKIDGQFVVTVLRKAP